MQVDWDTPVLDLKGKPILADFSGPDLIAIQTAINNDTLEDEDKVKAVKAVFATKAVPLTLGDCVGKALTDCLAGREPPKGLSKHKRFQLALLAAAGGKCDIKIEEAADIKLCADHLFNALVYGRIYMLLEEAAGKT